MNEPSKKLMDTTLEVGWRWFRKISESPLRSFLSCALTEKNKPWARKKGTRWRSRVGVRGARFVLNVASSLFTASEPSHSLPRKKPRKESSREDSCFLKVRWSSPSHWAWGNSFQTHSLRDWPFFSPALAVSRRKPSQTPSWKGSLPENLLLS